MARPFIHAGHYSCRDDKNPYEKGLYRTVHRVHWYSYVPALW